MSLAKRFGLTALKARELLLTGDADTPRDAWDIAALNILKKQVYVEKPCPRSAFLGLCEEGFIKGVPRGNYCRATKNKEYAISAVNMLKKNPRWRSNKKDLWNEIVKDNPITHNYQLDIVFEFWDNNLLNI